MACGRLRSVGRTTDGCARLLPTRFRLALLLAVFSGSAAAEWVQVGGNDPLTAYADPTTIRWAGSLVKMSVLYNFKITKTSPSGKSFMSVKEQDEFDCKDERNRVLDFTMHSGQMGIGDVVLANAEALAWQPVPAGGSVIEPLWKFACGKK